MRDIFTEIFENQPIDPTESARRSLRTRLRARFYEKAEARETAEGFQILLDGKPVRTPARKTLAAPVRPLADALVAEWNAQMEAVDPSRMPLTRLANAIIDGVAAAPRPVAAEIEQYLGTDLLFYRADTPDGLIESQGKHWDPVIEWTRDTLGARFVLAQGVVFAKQPEGAVASAAQAIPADGTSVKDLWRLGALSSVTTLTGSALLALALGAGRLTPDETWVAAHVDEDWNMQTWGRDDQALERRDYRRTEFDAAALVLHSLR